MEDVKEKLKRVQFDRWTFSGLDESAVVPHAHEDHDPTVCDDVPEPVYVHVVHFKRLRKHEEVWIKQVDPRRRPARLEKGFFGIPLYRRELEKRYEFSVPDERLHAAWWLFKTIEGKALFIGELDSPEVELVSNVVDRENLSVAILPSYGGMSETSAENHRFTDPSNEKELKEKIARLAKSLKARGIEVWAVPHPVSSEWSTRTAWNVC